LSSINAGQNINKARLDDVRPGGEGDPEFDRIVAKAARRAAAFDA
jgi:hypothetical protein